MDNKEVINNIDLNFGPSWARQSADKWVLSETGTKQRPKFKGDWRRSESRDRGESRSGRRSGGSSFAGKPAMKKSWSAEKPGRQQISAAPLPNLTITLVPEHRGLKPLVRLLAGTRRAYSIFEIAAKFLSRPEYYAAIVIAPAQEDGAPAQSLFQCSECRNVFTTKKAALAHGLSRHVDMFYEQEEKQNESPQGNFICVARCKLSGALLGPPNYHGFSEKLAELYRSRFSGMPLAEYRRQIVNETDPAIIEQWKKEASRKVIYRTRLLQEPVVFENAAQVEQHFADNYAPALIREGARFLVPATVSQNLEDPQIKTLIQDSWKKEIRFPINMAVDIQQKFRRLGLHIFKSPARTTFVSAIKPHPINTAQTTEIIRNILEWIKSHSGKTRLDLAADLAPGMAPDSPAVAEVINSLVWLIDRGHAIEFSSGVLAVPNRMLFGGKDRQQVSQASVPPQSGSDVRENAQTEAGREMPGDSKPAMTAKDN